MAKIEFYEIKSLFKFQYYFYFKLKKLNINILVFGGILKVMSREITLLTLY